MVGVTQREREREREREKSKKGWGDTDFILTIESDNIRVVHHGHCICFS